MPTISIQETSIAQDAMYDVGEFMVDQEMSALSGTPLQGLQQKARTEAQLPWEKSKIETTTPQAIADSRK